VRQPRPILMLAEGDPETWNSWSGSSRSIVMAMRRTGRDVRTGDVALNGLADSLTKAATFHARRSRWVQRYHTSSLGFRLRSARARRLAAAHPAGAPVLQVGASFHAGGSTEHPLYCVSDANAAFAAKAGANGPLSQMSKQEVSALIEQERRVYRQCAGIFTFTEAVRRSFIEDFGIDPQRVATTFQGPNLEYFPTQTDLDTAKGPNPTVLFIGRRFERKGGPTVLAAFEKVRAAIPDARLLLAGCKPDSRPQAGVEVLGMVPRDDPGEGGIKALFLQGDIFCMPSHYEPFGTVFAEAMLYGLPCIGSRAHASEVITDGVTGWLVDAGDVDGLARVLIEGLSDRTRLRAMGREGRRKAIEYFNWDRVARIVLEIIGRTMPG